MHLCLQQSLLQRKRSRNASCTGVRPTSRSAWWIDGQFHEISAADGNLRATIRKVAESEDESSRVSGALNAALGFRDGLNQCTTNPRIRGLFQSTIASLLTVNSWQLPARLCGLDGRGDLSNAGAG
jgi:hypothetical protein